MSASPSSPQAPSSTSHLARRALVASSVAVVVGAVALGAYAAASVVLVAFAGLVLGVFLHGLARWLSEHTPLPYRPALGVVAVVLLGAVAAVSVFVGPSVATQVDELAGRVPAVLSRFEAWLRGYSWGRSILEGTSLDAVTGDAATGSDGGAGGSSSQSPQADGGLSGSGVLQPAVGLVQGALTSAATLVGYVLLILFVGLYLAIAPRFYPSALVRLVPIPHRERAWDVLRAVARALRRWLVGRLASMLVVGVLTFLGLWALGIPLPATLALIAAVLSFVPNLGPILSAVPAILVALGEGRTAALYVVGLYLLVQTVESYLITPFIQQRAVSIPPALLLTVQVVMGVLFGILGLWLATPLAVTVIVLVQMLYVEDRLGDDVPIMGSGES